MAEKYFAVVGDVHGNMNLMVDLLSKWEVKNKIKLSFVLQVGDFEPHRNKDDVLSMAAPSKYKKLGDFPEYFKGKRTFPWLVYFIGGNHEPYIFLDHISEGGAIINNCFYFGRSGVTTIEGLRVAGLSGIYDSEHYDVDRPSVEKFGLISNSKYSYFNSSDIDALLADAENIDILVLHDWPSRMYKTSEESSYKSLTTAADFTEEVGNEYARLLIEILEPKYVFCGHMHKRYSSLLITESGREVRVECLASIKQKGESFIVLSSNDIK